MTMKRINRGKDFEEAISNCLDKSEFEISFNRLPDPMGGFSGVKNICDFSMYKYPYEYYLECKSKYGNTLNFKGDITSGQWSGLLNKSAIQGCLAGVCVWFMDYDTTVFVTIQELEQLKQSGKKSLNISDIQNNKISYFNIPGKKKRIMFDYDTYEFCNRLYDTCNSLWGKDGNK